MTDTGEDRTCGCAACAHGFVPSDEPNVSVDDLAEWLCDQGLAEERGGYGHATGWQIAESLLGQFNVTYNGGDG